VRAFRVKDALAGRSIVDVERSFAPARVFIQRLRRGSEILDTAPDTLLRAGDVAVVGARRHVLLAEGAPFGEEVEDRELLDIPMAALDVVVTRREIAERLPGAREHGRTARAAEDRPCRRSSLRAGTS
jgi:putative transport protein